MLKQKLKADSILIGTVLFIAIGIMLFHNYFNKNIPAEAVFYQGDTEIGRYSLVQEQIITVTDENGGYNLVMISAGTVQVTDADCPDKLCVKQRAIDGNGESIICLPHKLVIEIISGKENGMDAITN